METAQQVITETEAKRRSSFSFTHSKDDGRKSDSDGDGDGDGDSYIEIELEPVWLRDDKVAADHVEELEMRISFSSSAVVALPDVVSMDESFDKPPRSPLFSSSLSEWSFSSAETSNSWSAPLSCQKQQRTIEHRDRVRSPTISRLVGTFLTSSGKFSEIGDKPGRQIDASNSNYWEFAQSRGSCNNGSIVKRRQQGGGMIMKIWMKLRSKKLRALLESLLKAPQLNSEGGFSKKKSTVGDGFDRCQKGTSRRSGGGEGRAKSCPVSSKASPLHPREREAKLLAGECSIQAAIAHCKRSYA